MGQQVRGLLLNISEKLHVYPHIHHAHAIHSATVSTLGALTKAESDNCLLCRGHLLNISREKPHTVPLYLTVTKTVYKITNHSVAINTRRPPVSSSASVSHVTIFCQNG